MKANPDVKDKPQFCKDDQLYEEQPCIAVCESKITIVNFREIEGNEDDADMNLLN